MDRKLLQLKFEKLRAKRDREFYEEIERDNRLRKLQKERRKQAAAEAKKKQEEEEEEKRAKLKAKEAELKKEAEKQDSIRRIELDLKAQNKGGSEKSQGAPSSANTVVRKPEKQSVVTTSYAERLKNLNDPNYPNRLSVHSLLGRDDRPYKGFLESMKESLRKDIEQQRGNPTGLLTGDMEHDARVVRYLDATTPKFKYDYTNALTLYLSVMNDPDYYTPEKLLRKERADAFNASLHALDLSAKEAEKKGLNYPVMDDYNMKDVGVSENSLLGGGAGTPTGEYENQTDLQRLIKSAPDGYFSNGIINGLKEGAFHALLGASAGAEIGTAAGMGIGSAPMGVGGAIVGGLVGFGIGFAKGAVEADGYFADAFTAHQVNMNDGQADLFAGKQVRSGEMLDQYSKTKPAIDRLEKLAVLQEYFNLKDANDSSGKLNQIRSIINELYAYEAKKGMINDLFLMDQYKALYQYKQEDEYNRRLFSDMLGNTGTMDLDFGFLNSLGAWFHDENRWFNGDANHKSISEWLGLGAIDNVIGDDVNEGKAFALSYRPLSIDPYNVLEARQLRASDDQRFVDYYKRKNEEWLRGIDDNLASAKEWKKDHEISEFYNEQERAASSDIWDIRNVMFKQPGQQGFSDTQYYLQYPTTILRGTALALGGGWGFALNTAATGMQIESGRGENNQEVTEGFKQRLTLGLKKSGIYDRVMEEGRSKFGNLWDYEIIDKIARQEFKPTSSQALANIEDVIIDVFRDARKGANNTFNRDMFATTIDAGADWITYMTSGIPFMKASKLGLANTSSGYKVGQEFGSLINPITGQVLGATTAAGKTLAKNAAQDVNSLLRGNRFYDRIFDYVSNKAKMLTEIPFSVVKGEKDAAKAFLQYQRLKKPVDKVKEFGLMYAKTGFSESIEEGKQYINQRDWVLNEDPDQVTSFVGNIFKDMSVGNSLVPAALGIPFGARWGLAATDNEMYENMAGGWLGGTMHNIQVRTVEGALTTLARKKPSMSVDEILAQNATSMQESALNEYLTGAKIASQIGTARDKREFDALFDEFRRFQKRREEAGLEHFTQDLIDREQEIIDKIVKISNNPHIQERFQKAGIGINSTLFHKAVSAYAMIDNMQEEAEAAIDELNPSINSAINRIVNKMVSYDNEGDIKFSEEAKTILGLFNPVRDKDGNEVKRDQLLLLKKGVASLINLSMLDNLGSTIETADLYAERRNRSDVKFIKSRIARRMASMRKGMNEAVLSTMLKNPSAYIGEDDFLKISDALLMLFGRELDRETNLILKTALIGSTEEEVSKEIEKNKLDTNLLLDSLFAGRIQTNSATALIDSLDANVANHYNLLDNIQLEYLSRIFRMEELANKNAAKALAVAEQEAAQEQQEELREKNDVEQFMESEGTDIEDLTPAQRKKLEKERKAEEKRKAKEEQKRKRQEERQKNNLNWRKSKKNKKKKTPDPQLPFAEEPEESPKPAPAEPAPSETKNKSSNKTSNEPTPAPEAAPEAAPELKSEYDANNKVFTEDAKNAALERLKKLRNRLNRDIDPEVIECMVEIMGYHVKAGVRLFADLIKNVYKDLRDSDISHTEIASIGDKFKQWYGALYKDPRSYDYWDDMTTPQDVRNVAIDLLLQECRLEYEKNGVVEDMRKQFIEEFKAKNNIDIVVESTDEALAVKANTGDRIAIITPDNKTAILIVEFEINGKILTLEGEDGLIYASHGKWLLEPQSRAIAEQKDKESNVGLKEVVNALEQKIKEDNDKVEVVTGHDYVIKENGKLVLYPRVHTLLGDQYERSAKEVLREKELYPTVRTAVAKRDYETLQELLKSVPNGDVYIKILQQDKDLDYEVTVAIVSLIARTEPGVSVDLGNILDEIGRIFFDSDLMTVKPLNYATLTINLRGKEIPVRKLMSEHVFNLIVNDFDDLKNQYKDCVFSTKKHSWHATVRLPDNTLQRVAGETDIIAVHPDGTISIIDIKTSNKSFYGSTQTIGKDKVYQPSHFELTHPLRDGRSALRSTKVQYAMQQSMYMLMIRESMPSVLFNDNPIHILPFRLDYDFNSASNIIDKLVNDQSVEGMPLTHAKNQKDPNNNSSTLPLEVQENIIDGTFMMNIPFIDDAVYTLEDEQKYLERKGKTQVSTNTSIEETNAYNEIVNLNNEIYNLSLTYANAIGQKIDEIYNLVKQKGAQLELLIEAYKQKYPNANDKLGFAMQTLAWTKGLAPRVQEFTQRTNPNDGLGWRDHNTVDNKQIRERKDKTGTITLGQAAANLDFVDNAICTVVRSDYYSCLVRIDYNGYVFENITILYSTERGSNKLSQKGLSMKQAVDSAIKKAQKEGGVVRLTGMYQTAGIFTTEDTDIFGSPIVDGADEYHVSMDTSLDHFGIAKLTKEGDVIVVSRSNDGLTKSERQLHLFPKGQGIPGLVYMMLRGKTAKGGDIAQAAAAAMVHTRLTDGDAQLIINLCKQLINNINNTRFTIDANGRTYEFPLTVYGVFKMFFNLGTYADYNKGVHIKIEGSKVVFTYKTKDGEQKAAFNPNDAEDVKFMISFLKTNININVDVDFLLQRLGKTKIAEFFRNNGIDKVTLGNSRITFSKEDFDDPNTPGDQSGMTGLAWMIKNKMIKPRITGVTNPRISFTGCEHVPVVSVVDDVVELTGGEIYDLQDIDTMIDFDIFGDEHKLIHKAAKTVNKEKAIKHIRRFFGNKCSVEVVENISNFVRNTSAYCVGRVVGGVMYLAERAEYGTEYHEAFHIVTRLLLPEKMQKTLWSAVRRSMAKRYGKKAAKQASDKALNEFGANLCRRFFLKQEEINFNLLHVFSYLYQHYLAFKEVGDLRMYLFFIAMKSGVFKLFNRDISKDYQEDYKYQIRGVGFDHIYNDKMYDTLKRSVVYYLVYMLNIGFTGKHIERLDLTKEGIDKKITKTKVDNKGRHIHINESVRTVMLKSCRTEAGKLAINEIFDNWEAVKPDIENYIGEIGIDYNEVEREKKDEANDGDESSMAGSPEIGLHTKAAYETSRYVKSTSGIRFFSSMLKKKTLDDNGRYQDVRNELGLYEFMDSRDVINRILGDCWKVRTVDLMINKFQQLSKKDPMYAQLYAIVSLRNRAIVKEDGSISYNAEQFVTLLFNLVACTQMNFKYLEANQNKDKTYVLRMRDCGQDYEAKQYRRTWGGLLTHDGRKLFRRGKNGALEESRENSIKLLGRLYDQLAAIKQAYNNDYKNLSEQKGQPSLEIIVNGQKTTINVAKEEDTRILKKYVCNQLFPFLGIQMTKPEFDYMLNQLFPDASSEMELMFNFFTLAGESDIANLWSPENCLVRKINGEWVRNYNPETNLIFSNKLNRRINVEDLYVRNSFASMLSYYKYQYQHMSSELSVLVSKGNKFYVMSESNLINDVTLELAEGQEFLDQLSKDCYVYIEELIDDSSQYRKKGSLLVKQALKARNEGRQFDIRVATPVLFKTTKHGDQGSDYFEISEREDYAMKTTIIEEGGIIFPTMSDKKTWAYILGVKMPGIKYLRDRNGKVTGIDDMLGGSVINEQVDQLIEYAETELAAIRTAIQQIKDLPEQQKIANYHKLKGVKGKDGKPLKDINGKEVKVANGTVFSTLTGVYEGNTYIPFNRLIDNEGRYISPEKNIEIAEKYFFNKSTEEKREIIKYLVKKQACKEMEHMHELGIIGMATNGGFVNIGLNDDAISAIAKSKYADKPNAKLIALYHYVLDMTYKSIMSLNEIERVYSGHPGFFKYVFDEEGKLVNRTTDEFKRFGGLISTGTINNVHIKGAPEDGMYTCAEVDNEEVGSKQIDLIEKMMSEGEWKQAARQIMAEHGELDQPNSRICDEVSAFTTELAMNYVKENNELIYHIIKAKIEQEVASYKKGIDVADGGAYISPQMTEWLLRMCGEFDNRIKQAFDILNDPKADVYKQVEAYRLVTTKVIGAQKYTAYGMRLTSDGKTNVPYYNKMALFPIFKCIATGDFAQIYDRMQNNTKPDGTPDPVHMLMINSAVKVGSQGSQSYTTNEGFKFNTYKQPFSRLRKQFNTNPHHLDEQSMGTQMVKVALASLVAGKVYTRRDGSKVRGEQLLRDIMNRINALSHQGLVELRNELYDKDGKVSQEKLSDFLHSQLTSRDADKSILDSISIIKDQHGNKQIKHPLSAISRLSWLLSIIVSHINKKVIELKTLGLAFYQRSVWRMEKGEYNVMSDEDIAPQINNGEELKMIIEEGPAKGAMDCVLTMDYFADILKKAGLAKASFEELRQALIDAKIIGKDANAAFVGYRIPTQAQSSIHPMRCVDVLPVIQHNIILPKEFTKITGSDFDIDKIFIGSLNFNLKKTDEGWINDVSEINKNNKLKLLNDLIEDYITVLTDSEGGHIAHRSIDKDTELIDNVIGEIEDRIGKSENQEVMPYDFYSLRTQTATKNDFLTGKVGIGPYALNNNSHILTVLYGLSFSDKSIMKRLNHERLDRTIGDDGLSIYSWLSALINIHVDAAKDPKMTKLNVNPMTYNLVSLLIRTGYGNKTFHFTRQRVMVEMAKQYAQANSKYLQEEGKSSWLIRNEAKRNAAVAVCGEDAVISMEALFIKDGEWTKHAYSEAERILSDNSLLENIGIVDPTFQAKVYLIDKMLENPAQSLSSLVQYSKIDTKKQGKNITEQLAYLRGVAKVFNDKKALEQLYFADKSTEQRLYKNYYGFDPYLEEQDEELKEEQYDSDVFEQKSLKRLYEESFIKFKTHTAIFTFIDIMKGQVLEATPVFLHIVMLFAQYLNKTDAHSLAKISDALVSRFKSESIADYIEKNGIDVKGLVSGINTIYDRLSQLRCDLVSDEKYKDMIDGEGKIKNALLDLLIPDKSVLFIKYSGSIKDKLDNAKFVKLFDALDVSSSKRDYIIQAWDDLLHDDKHPELKEFARDLCVYAFITSADINGSNTIFSFVPNSFREECGYVDAIRKLLEDFQDESTLIFINIGSIIDDVILNNWNDYTFVPTVKLLDEKSEVKWRGIMHPGVLDEDSKEHAKYPIFLTTDKNGVDKAGNIPTFVKVKRYDGRTLGSQREYTVFQLVNIYHDANTDKKIPVYAKINSRGYEIDGYRIYEYGKLNTQDFEFVPSVGALRRLIELSEELCEQYAKLYGKEFISALMMGDLPEEDKTRPALVNNAASEWSEKEGWSEEHFYSKVMPKVTDAWLVEFELVEDLTVTPNFTGLMNMEYGKEKRKGVESNNTLEAIKNGERTATTRYGKDGNMDYWSQVKIGDIIEWKDNKGNSVKVRVIVPFTKLTEKYLLKEQELNPQSELKHQQLVREETIKVLGGDETAEQDFKDAISVAKQGMSFKETLNTVNSIFTKEEVAQIEDAISKNGKGKLVIKSVSRMTDPVFFKDRVISFLEENAKKPFTDPTRTVAIEIWTKHDGLPLIEILEACKKYKVAPVVSFSITSMGDTAIEKGVMKYTDLLPRIKSIIDQGLLDPRTTTVRLDPILVGFTNSNDLTQIVRYCKSMGILKFVTSIVLSYGYLVGTARDRKVIQGVNKSFLEEGKYYDWEKYYGIITEEDYLKSSEFIQHYHREYNKDAQWHELISAGMAEGVRVVAKSWIGKMHHIPRFLYIELVGEYLKNLVAEEGIQLETCSFTIAGLDYSACLDPLILERVTGLSLYEDGKYPQDTSRPECMCYGVHQDMFRFSDKCASSCAYCYAAHSDDNPFRYYDEDGNLKDNVFTRTSKDEPSSGTTSSELPASSTQTATETVETNELQQDETYTVQYTPKGKARLTYTVRGEHIYNKNDKEVFISDSVDRNKILTNLAIIKKEAVIVTYNTAQYVVYKDGRIVSVTTGKSMLWHDGDGNRSAILNAAQAKFDEKLQGAANLNVYQQLKEAAEELRKICGKV